MLDQDQRPSIGHKILMTVLFSLTVIATIYLAYSGWEYYAAEKIDRGHMVMHGAWKAGGSIGHGLGILGSLLMLLMMLYIPRKNWRRLQNVGKLRHWLNIHIWMGLTGPILITFHSTFKFGGIVAISYWSMVAVALSGVLGRYIYGQIPRTMGGDELTEADLDEVDRQLVEEMRQIPGMTPERIAQITRTMSAGGTRQERGLLAVFGWFWQDLTRPFRTRALIATLQRDTEIPLASLRDLVHTGRRRALLIRRRAFLGVARTVLHHWHVVHRPFALVMFIIMFVHIGVALLFGYTWLF